MWRTESGRPFFFFFFTETITRKNKKKCFRKKKYILSFYYLCTLKTETLLIIVDVYRMFSNEKNNKRTKKSLKFVFFFLIICISLFFSYFLLPVAKSRIFFISWFCFDCLWFSFAPHIVLARRWRSITSKAGGLSGFVPSTWCPADTQKETEKPKKKGTKQKKNISWYLFGESRPSVSRIWLTAVIECQALRESWRRIKAALAAG